MRKVCFGVNSLFFIGLILISIVFYGTIQKSIERPIVREIIREVSKPVVIPPRMPINIETSGSPQKYNTIGFLSDNSKDSTMLPLVGRELHNHKWQYYTMSDKYNSIQLPVMVNGKDGSGEYGCDEVTSGDSIFVKGYNKPFKVTLYEKDKLQYIPYL